MCENGASGHLGACAWVRGFKYVSASMRGCVYVRARARACVRVSSSAGCVHEGRGRDSCVQRLHPIQHLQIGAQSPVCLGHVRVRMNACEWVRALWGHACESERACMLCVREFERVCLACACVHGHVCVWMCVCVCV